MTCVRIHLVLSTFLILCAVSAVEKTECQEIMPLSNVKPGMTGTSKTVFMGDDIEEFGVEVLDIIPNYYPQQDVILVRLTGEKVEHTGVVAGMSGSPVYIDGKLVGALSFGFGVFSKEPLAGITPIEQMLVVLNKEKKRESRKRSQKNQSRKVTIRL